MTFNKFIVLFTILAVANAGVPQLYQAPVAPIYQQSPTLVKQLVPLVYQQTPTLVKQVIHSQPIVRKTTVHEYYPNPEYSYSYDVQNVLAGDSKRFVDYNVDPINGFNGIISHQALAVKSIASPQPIVKTVPIIYAAPAIYAQSTRLTYPVPSASHTKSASFPYVAPDTYIKSSQD